MQSQGDLQMPLQDDLPMQLLDDLQMPALGVALGDLCAGPFPL